MKFNHNIYTCWIKVSVHCNILIIHNQWSDWSVEVCCKPLIFVFNLHHYKIILLICKNEYSFFIYENWYNYCQQLKGTTDGCVLSACERDIRRHWSGHWSTGGSNTENFEFVSCSWLLLLLFNNNNDSNDIIKYCYYYHYFITVCHLPLSHGRHIVLGDQKSFVLPRQASQWKPWGWGLAW